MIRHLSIALTMAAATFAAGQMALAQSTDQDSSSAQTQSSSQHRKSKAEKMQAGSTSGSLSAADQEFITEAAKGGMAEVKLGQLAQQRAASDEVKKFGQQMVDDHGKANDQLKQLAQSKSVTLPDSLDAKDQALYDKLSGLNGMEFDHAYMAAMRKDHRKDVAEFRKESMKAQDPDLKNFATATLPVLETHLRIAEATGMGSKTRANTDNSGGNPAPMK